MARPAVLFDLLTALLDSWTVWDRAAGERDAGRRWRAKYLELTYGCGAYRPYETLVREAALATASRRTMPMRWKPHGTRSCPGTTRANFSTRCADATASAW